MIKMQISDGPSNVEIIMIGLVDVLNSSYHDQVICNKISVMFWAIAPKAPLLFFKKSEKFKIQKIQKSKIAFFIFNLIFIFDFSDQNERSKMIFDLN